MKDDIYNALKDRLEAWELVELLDIPIDDILLEFEDKIMENLDEIYEILNLERDNEKQQ